MARYLMQHPNGYVYPYTPALANRKDMSEISVEEAAKRLVSQTKGNVIPAPTAVPVEKMDIDGVATQMDRLREERDKALALLGIQPEDLYRDETPPESRVIMDEPPDAGEPQVEAPTPPKSIPPSEIINKLEAIQKQGRGKVQVELLMRQHFGYEVDRREKLDTIVGKAIGYIQSKTPQPVEATAS